MSKIQGSAKNIIVDELKTQDYHTAYRTLNAHFIRMGISKIVDQEKRVRATKLLVGMSFSTYLRDLREGFIEWASIQKIREYSEDSTKDLADFELNTTEMKDNSGGLTDPEFSLIYGFRPMISHATRVEILISGVSCSSRFSITVATINSWKTNQKLYSVIVEML